MKVEHAWVCYRGVERIDTLCSKYEHSLNSTKTVKNLWLITMKTNCCTKLTYLRTTAFPHPPPPRKNVVKGEFVLSMNLLKRTLNLLRTVRKSRSNDACYGARPVK